MRRHFVVYITALVLLLQPALEACAVDPVAAKRSEITSLRAQIDQLDAQIRALEEERVSLEGRLEGLASEIQTSEKKVRVLEAEVRARKEALGAHVRRLYMESDTAPLVFLLSAKDFASLVERARVLAFVVESDQENLKRLASARRELDAALAQLREEQTRQRAYIQAHEQQIAQLEQLKEARRRALARAGSELAALLSAPARSTRVTVARGEERDSSGPPYDLSGPVSKKLVEVNPYGGGWLTSTRMPSSYQATGNRWTCYASWYGNEFHGRRTASGEIFNQWDFTCAHRSLPFGTYVAIEYRGRRIVAKVTDRGPFIAGREFDLSRGCAEALGYSGVARITVEIVRPAR